MTSMTFADFVKVRLVRLYLLIVVGVVLGAFVLAVRLTIHDVAVPSSSFTLHITPSQQMNAYQ